MSKDQIIYASMPLKDLKWVDVHDPQEFENYEAHFRGLAKKTVQFLENANSSSLNSFLIGAQQALQRYNATTRAHKYTQTTSFTFSETKDDPNQPVTIFIVVDSARMESQKDVIGLVQKNMYQELKRHPNENVPVTIISDETSNFKINDLISDISWTRGQSIIQLFVLQSGMAFEETYGKSSFDILLNESEVVVWLPGQRSQPMLDQISKSLGQTSVMMKNESGSLAAPEYYTSGWGYSEDGKPLMDADSIRRNNKSVVFIRRSRPALLNNPPYAAIDDVRDVASINPRYKKAFKKPISVWLNGDKPETRKTRLGEFLRKSKRRDEPLQNKKIRFQRYASLFRWFSWAAHNWWVAPLIYLLFFTSFPTRLLNTITGGF